MVVEQLSSRAEEIVACAWALAHTEGIGGFSLRALAREVGIQQPSLYAHFDSKHALYDAMFADGNQQLLARLDGLTLPADPRAALKGFLREFVGFALEDTERCYLIFFGHQLRRGLPLNKQLGAHHWVDGLNEVQIRERSHLSNDDLVTQLADIGPRAVAGRWATPPPMRHLPLPFGEPIGWAPLLYLLDVGFTRDVWAHRIDICVATGRDLVLTAEHDGRLVADIVAEWAARHGEPFELTLEGPAGGTFASGEGGEHRTIDAIEFIRTLAGRRPGTGVLRHPLPL